MRRVGETNYFKITDYKSKKVFYIKETIYIHNHHSVEFDRRFIVKETFKNNKKNLKKRKNIYELDYENLEEGFLTSINAQIKSGQYKFYKL